MHTPKIRMTALVLAASLALLSILTGCGDELTSPGIQPEISNLTDNFQYQVTDVRNHTATATYIWQNTGTKADVNQATTVTDGSVRLVLLDADGTQVYSRSLADNGTFVSAAGTPGAWTVRVVYSSASATVNFRAQKST